MGIYDRDYMRSGSGREPEQPPGRIPGRKALVIIIAIIMLLIFIFAYVV